MALPAPVVVKLTVPEGSAAAIDAMLARGAAELADSSTDRELALSEQPDQVFYLVFVPPEAQYPPRDTEVMPIKLSLDPQLLAADADREVRAIYATLGTAGLAQLDPSLQFTGMVYQRENDSPRPKPLVPNASSFDTPIKYLNASYLVAGALRNALAAVEKEIATAVKAIGQRAVVVGRSRLLELRETIDAEAVRYVDPTALGFATAQALVAQSDFARLALRGPDMPALVAALAEIARDRLALERAAAAVNGGSGSPAAAHADFETATRTFMATFELACDEHPVLYRLWEKVRLPSNVTFDRRGNLVTSVAGSPLVSTFTRELGELLVTTSRANRALYAGLTPENVWELEPLIDLTLEELGEFGDTVWAQAARAEVARAAESTLVGTFANVAGIVQMGGVFLAAPPPVLLALAAVGLVLGIAALVEDYLELQLKDRAASASLDPQQALSTEPSHVGFYVSIACSLLDIRGVKDAFRTMRAARFGRELDAAAEAFGAAT